MKDRNGRDHGPDGRFVKMAGSIAKATKREPATDGPTKARRAVMGGATSQVRELLDLPDASAPLTGRETKTQLRALAKAEGISLGNGSREDLARELAGVRFNRDHGGARFFAGQEHDAGGSRPSRTGSLSGVAGRVASSAPARRSGSREVIVDQANQDLAGLSPRKLRAVAKAENIELSPSSDAQTLVNEISHVRSMRKRNFGGMFDGQ